MILFRAKFKSPIIPIAFFALCAALVLTGMPEPLLHPCHPGGAGGPGSGPPCPPTPTPAAAAGNPAGTGPVRFLVRNETGDADYVLQPRPGQTLPVTIRKRDYDVVLIGCLGPAEITFRASAGRTVEIECP